MMWLFQPIGLNPNCPWWAFLGFEFGVLLIGTAIGGTLAVSSAFVYKETLTESGPAVVVPSRDTNLPRDPK